MALADLRQQEQHCAVHEPCVESVLLLAFRRNLQPKTLECLYHAERLTPRLRLWVRMAG